MLAAHSQGHTVIWSAPNETPGHIALQHGLDTLPLGFGRQYAWADPKHGAELAIRFEDRISILSSVSSTCIALCFR